MPPSVRVTGATYGGFMYSTVTSCAIVGVEPRPVQIETTIAGGRGTFAIVGLPDAAVRESRERVKAAIRQQGFRFPTGRVLVNLSPADVPKQGATYDLPIALSVLSAALQEPVDFGPFIAVGELSLDGKVRPVRTALGAVDLAQREGKRCLASHLSAVASTDADAVAGIDSLAEAVAVARGSLRPRNVESISLPDEPWLDLSVVRGQHEARRALEIAAAGGHHLMLEGPPGAGKTLLARCLPGILPPLSPLHEREVALIWSLAGLVRPAGNPPPFRSPHHSSSLPALVGGGVGVPTAGEITKAHHGVLFLDELGEFPPATLDALRQPIEDGVVTVARSVDTIRFPARIQVVAATNPCPCGFLGDRIESCQCSDAQQARYRQRLSGPLLDRFDMRVWVPRLRAPDVRGPRGEPSSPVRDRVVSARSRQSARGELNRSLSGARLDETPITPAADRALLDVFDRGVVTGRGYDRVRRVARTIADLDGADEVSEEHVLEAVGLRGLE